ncbi:hypothetical protein VQ042_06505 [Aurantimonas sp. A2-1-M11]|uniref:hypothetical protein n=1 Tax=Aurantimonas sp. A2-1-M11 TaxID=3113712 RepID=UPI002F9526F8
MPKFIIVRASENLLCGHFATRTTATAEIAGVAISTIFEFMLDEAEVGRLSMIDTAIRVPDAAHDLMVYRLPDDLADIDEVDSSCTEADGPLENYRDFEVGALTERWHKKRKLCVEARMTGLVLIDESILEDRVVEATDRAHLGEIVRDLAGDLERRLDQRWGCDDDWRIVITDRTGGRKDRLVDYKYRAKAAA